MHFYKIGLKAFGWGGKREIVVWGIWKWSEQSHAVCSVDKFFPGEALPCEKPPTGKASCGSTICRTWGKMKKGDAKTCGAQQIVFLQTQLQEITQVNFLSHAQWDRKLVNNFNEQRQNCLDLQKTSVSCGLQHQNPCEAICEKCMA